MKVRLRAWTHEEFVELMGNVAQSKVTDDLKQRSDKAAVTFLAQLLVGVVPGFVPVRDRDGVHKLLDARRCAHLGSLMRHNVRACRFAADALVPAAALLTRQLFNYGDGGPAAAIEKETGLSVIEFIQFHLDGLAALSSTVIKTSVLQFFKFSGVSMASTRDLTAVAKAVLAVVHKEQCVTHEEEWRQFRRDYQGADSAELWAPWPRPQLRIPPGAHRRGAVYCAVLPRLRHPEHHFPRKVLRADHRWLWSPSSSSTLSSPGVIRQRPANNFSDDDTSDDDEDGAVEEPKKPPPPPSNMTGETMEIRGKLKEKQLVAEDVEVFVMYGSQLEHWLPLLGREQARKGERCKRSRSEDETDDTKPGTA